MEKKMLVISEIDNVGVVLEDVKKGDRCVFKAISVIAAEDIAFPHKVALTDFKAEDFVIKYGEHIGHALVPIPKGSLVHSHNMGCRRGTDKREETA
jgi:altronate hydrolase